MRTWRVAWIVVSIATAGSAWAADFAGPEAGVASALGPGAVALLGTSPGIFGNPALLPSMLGTETRLGAGLSSNDSPWQRFDLGWPTLRLDAFMLGGAREDDGDRRRSTLGLGYGRAFRGGLSTGGTVELRTEHGAGAAPPGFGLHLGCTYAPSAAHGLQFGTVLRNVLRDDQAHVERDRPEVRAGLARTWKVTPLFHATGTAGFEAASGQQGAAWLGTQLDLHDRIAIAASSSSAAARVGAGVRLASAWLEYGYASDVESAARHTLSVRVGLGPSMQSRRLAAGARADSSLASRVGSEMARRQERAIAARLSSGQRALEKQSFEQASLLFREVLLWNPEDSTAREGLRQAQRGALLVQADSAIAAADWWSATSQLEHVARLFPDDSLAVAKLEEVRGAVHRADRTRSEAAEQVRLGLDAYAVQRYAPAARCFEVALRLDPANQMAGEFLQRSRAASKVQVTTAVSQANARLEKHDVEGARTALEPALTDTPEVPEVQGLAAQIERETERQAEERRVAEVREKQQAVREDRSPAPISRSRLVATYDKGMQKFRAGDLAAAMSAWEDVARHKPHFEEVDRYLLRVYRVVGLENYTEGRLQEAIDIWSRALSLEPENPQLRRYLDQANAKLQRAQDPRRVR